MVVLIRSAWQAQVIEELNQVIGWWATTLSPCNDLLWHLLMNWASKRHPNKESHLLNDRYWHRIETEDNRASGTDK